MAVAAPKRKRAPDVSVPPEIAAQVEELLKRPYRIVVQGEPVEGYLAVVPELPGCVTAGQTPEEAMALLREAMRAWLESVLVDGLPAPEPAPQILATPGQRYSGKFVLRVPKSLHRRLAQRARAEGVSLNQLVLAYVSQGLGPIA